jgi:hypothetical protein
LIARVNHNAAVHLLIVDRRPVAVQANLGSLIGRAVKPFGKRPVDVRLDQSGVASVDGNGAVIGNLRDDRLQGAVAGGANLDAGKAGVGAVVPDDDVLDLELAARGRDAVEHLGQDQAVDDVAANLDVFDGGPVVGGFSRRATMIHHGSGLLGAVRQLRAAHHCTQ